MSPNIIDKYNKQETALQKTGSKVFIALSYAILLIQARFYCKQYCTYLLPGSWRGLQRHMAAIHLERAILTDALLQGSILNYAHLEGAALYEAHLEGVDAFAARFGGPVPANLRGVYFDLSTNLEQTILANDKHVGARLLDIHWGRDQSHWSGLGFSAYTFR